MTEELPMKKPHTATTIGTHSGTFHCDEALACFMLKQLVEYKHSEIVRSRDTATLSKCDVVVDVGGVYDPALNRFDHHQRSFTETMNTVKPDKPWTVRLSSAGLIYCHYGHRVIAMVMGVDSNTHTDIIDKIYDKVYDNLIMEIDAIDNGVEMYDGVKPKYRIHTNLSSRVSQLNPQWNSEDTDTEHRFNQAVTMVGESFTGLVHYLQGVWWPARQLVQSAISERFEVDSSGQILILNKGGCPWKEHLFELETELSIETPILFVLYTDDASTWRIQCVPVEGQSFQNRLSLLPEWQGLRDKELSDVSGIADCVFVHASGFIGGNKTKEGVLAMARQTLNKQ